MKNYLETPQSPEAPDAKKETPEMAFMPPMQPAATEEIQARKKEAKQIADIKKELVPTEKESSEENPERFKSMIEGSLLYLNKKSKSIKDKKERKELAELISDFILTDGIGEGLAFSQDKKAHRWAPEELKKERGEMWSVIKTLDPKLEGLLQAIKTQGQKAEDKFKKHIQKKYDIKISGIDAFYDQMDAITQKMINKAGFFARRAFISACAQLSLPQTALPEPSSSPSLQSEPPLGL